MNIADIAKMAGVSNAAVSRYFNNGYISEEKRETIRKVVEETGYHPSVQAQTLRTKKTKMIGVILPKIASSAMGNVVEGIIEVLNENDYHMLLADTTNHPKKELDYLRFFNDKQVDGVILIATVITAEHKRVLKSMKVPVVIIGQRVPGYYCVYHDDYHSVYDMTKLFLERGCRNLGFISVPHQDKAAGLSRYEGYCKAVEEAGLAPLKDNTIISDFSMESGGLRAKELLDKCGKLDGLICATDSISIGAMQYLKQAGYRIPQDIMLSGHGDAVITDVTSPTITSVHYSYKESGITGAQRIIELLKGAESSVREIMLGYTIVEKDSTTR